MWMTETAESIAVIIPAILALLIALLAVGWVLALKRRFEDRVEKLEVQLNTLQEQSRLELMAMGQRVMAADRIVNRFAERIDALEATQSPGERYGQLQGLAVQTERGAELSAAEAELVALLQRQQK
jgi:vacuolar-type H+-ATPase subunit I/STV1